MGDLSESAMEAARARQEVLAKPTGALGRLEDISIQLAGITGKVKNNMQKQQQTTNRLQTFTKFFPAVM